MSILSELLVQQEGAVVTLVINLCEKHNFLTVSCLERITSVMDELGKDPSVQAVVIRGAGDKAFSSGYDIGAISEVEKTLAEMPEGDTLPLEKAISSLERFPFPVIAMVNGVAYGGGCELAMACDIRIGAIRTKMSMPPARLGIVYPWKGYQRFMRIIGFAKTLEVFLTAKIYGSQECLDMGMVNYVVPDQNLEEFTYSLAADICKNAPLSLKGTKLAIRTIADQGLLNQNEKQSLMALFTSSLKSSDAKEGIRSFAEKRLPVFHGR